MRSYFVNFSVTSILKFNFIRNVINNIYIYITYNTHIHTTHIHTVLDYTYYTELYYIRILISKVFSKVLFLKTVIHLHSRINSTIIGQIVSEEGRIQNFIDHFLFSLVILYFLKKFTFHNRINVYIIHLRTIVLHEPQNPLQKKYLTFKSTQFINCFIM